MKPEQNKPFTRIGDKLVMDMEEPKLTDFIFSDRDKFEAEEDYGEALLDWKQRPSYPITPSDLKEFEEGKQYYEGKDFEVMFSYKWPGDGRRAFPIHKPEQKDDINPETGKPYFSDIDPNKFNKHFDKPEQKTMEDEQEQMENILDGYESVQVQTDYDGFKETMWPKGCIFQAMKEWEQVTNKERDERIAKLEKVAKELHAMIQNIFED